MNSAQTTRTRRPRRLLGPFLAGVALLCATAALADPELSARRADRRERLKAASLRAAGDGTGAPFGLLVIPVDFADLRLPVDWRAGSSLTPQLTGDGASLRRWFDIASGERCELRVTVASPVHLPGARRDYADPPTGGTAGTRALARTALEAVRDTGLPLRLLDMDGPDGLAGTADDDGWVDGVLILHAGDGQENGGLIAPLQYYLDEPVTGDGVAASAYAVASMHSGTGIWVHETMHLLGLEERYDPTLPSDAGDSELHSRGGLGAFSVMAAGTWGTGGGDGCALLDAYSGWQLGWYDAVDLPLVHGDRIELAPSVSSRQVARVWTHGVPGDEFFMLEVRDPVAAAPFDAAVPGGSLVITHIDERVPDGWLLQNGDGSWRLRARLVEADGNEDVREGRNEGGEQDLFPGSLGVTAFTPTTVPGSAGWSGPSYVSLTGIVATASGVAADLAAEDGPAIRHALSIGPEATAAVDLVVQSLGEALAAPTARLTAAAPTHGSFDGVADFVDLVLIESSPGRWVPDRAVTWVRAPSVPADASTRFVLRVTDGAWQSGLRSTTWYWSGNADAFDFAATWPGGWEIDQPDLDTDTTWRRWSDLARTWLVCTGSAHATPDDWPDVRYRPDAHTTLTSPSAGPGIAALRVVHAWDAETLPTGEGMDGGSLEWVAPDGTVRPAVPVDDWPARLSGTSDMALHGRGGFAGAMDLVDDQPVWRVDVVNVPTDAPGPWRLRFSFASNGVYSNQRGWLVAEVRPLAEPVGGAAIPIRWDGRELAWEVPPDWTAPGEVEILEEGDWRFFAVGTPAAAAGTAGAVLNGFTGRDRARHVVRVVGPAGAGSTATRDVVIYPDGGEAASPFLGLPWPNPARSEVRFLLEVPNGQGARLRIFDLRGRLLREESHPAGSHLLSWYGTDRNGRRVASGTYFLQVEGPAGSQTHKVVFLH